MTALHIDHTSPTWCPNCIVL